MSLYKELLAQRVKLEEEIERLRLEERDSVMNEILQKMSDYQISVQELSGGKKTKGTAGSKSEVCKYRNPETGDEWSGRGRPPAWIKDVGDRTAYLI